MVAYLHDGERGLEAGIKYLVLAGASSGFFLFGIAFYYLEWGTLDLSVVPSSLAAGDWSPVVLAGMALLTVGIGFKLALVPFHLWTPDVYQGAPAPVTAFLATVSKGAVLAFLLRVAMTLPGFNASTLWTGLAILAAASMVAGNLLALLQDDVKRILAYSSIAHLGYLLVPVLAGGRNGFPATAFYLAAYFATTLAAFGVVGALGEEGPAGTSLTGIEGLWWRRPLPAAVLSVALFSLAGLPLTAGFIGKFYLLTAGVGESLWALVFLLAGTSVVGLFYYLRVMARMFSAERSLSQAGVRGTERSEPYGRGSGHGRSEPAWSGQPGWATGFVLVVLLLLLVGIGVWPGPLLDLLRNGAGMLVTSPELFPS